MILKRNWFLKQLGITQWILRTPNIVKDKTIIHLSSKIRLLIISNIFLSNNDPLFIDIIYSLGFKLEQTYQLKPYQIKNLSKNIKYMSWWIGIKKSFILDGVKLYTPILTELSQNSSEKRILWKQIYNNEKYFKFNNK
ncbi:DNA polymerase III subunit psi [Serratia symbiotica]|nr:DNA polymerase III subunit psi [Serratia symbiotica]